ncbi:hypothetical protein FEZ08_07010 [Culicoidibacter larvae]|uniref:Uncharacterized protein n=2 Tax=Culicoidibacter larvae TaxID=2579976 RepID=A0A5R8QD16_9FIRM|nr:hypothetical protein FEZ08_07010 [Culicoidibacter larvae]
MASEIALLIGFAIHIFRDLYLLATGTVINIPGPLSAIVLGMYYPSAFNTVAVGWNPDFIGIIIALVVYLIIVSVLFLVSIQVFEHKVGIYIVLSRLFLLASGLAFVYFQTTGMNNVFSIIAPMFFIIAFLFLAATILNTIRLHRMLPG